MYFNLGNLDYTYILVLIGALISFIASLNVNRTFNKYNKVANQQGIRACQVAEGILRANGITDVQIERVSGKLTDHYSPSDKKLRLSDAVYGSTSVGAIGVAAHECGHAIQHNKSYAPMSLRTLFVPLVNIGSKLSWPIILLGLLFGWMRIAKIGVFLFALVVLFQLITLPVEINASNRAMKSLQNNTLLQKKELSGARKVLTAAAFTYVAALFSSILQLLRLVLLVRRGSSRRS